MIILLIVNAIYSYDVLLLEFRPWSKDKNNGKMSILISKCFIQRIDYFSRSVYSVCHGPNKIKSGNCEFAHHWELGKE